jgi:cytidylate kinase
LNPNTIPVITIDGPSGVGKGTVTHLIAHELGWHILDSGVVYRALALCAKRHKIDLNQQDLLARLAAAMDLTFKGEDLDELPRIILEGEDITDVVRAEETGQMASQVSVHPPVRAALLERQRGFRQKPGLVTDGRDMGTVVFPDAVLKVFLTASAQERAQRRYNQLNEKGMSVNLSHLQQEIAARDQRDSTREVSPLVPAADAVVIDTTELTVAQVFERIMEEVRKHIPNVLLL